LNLGQGTVTGALVANSGGGAITQSGGLTVTGTTSLTATGAAITLSNAANDFTVMNATATDVTLVDINSIALGNITATGTLSVTAGTNITRNALDNLSAGTANLIATTGFIGTPGGVTTGPATTGTALNFTSISTINVGAFTTADFTGPVTIPGIFNLSPVATSVFYNGINVTPASAGVQAAIQAAVISAIAAAGDLAAAAFGSESVSKQIANGFPGDIGTSPPGIDNIVDSGIRLPDVNESSADRKKREDAEEEERKRKLKLKVSQAN